MDGSRCPCRGCRTTWMWFGMMLHAKSLYRTSSKYRRALLTSEAMSGRFNQHAPKPFRRNRSIFSRWSARRRRRSHSANGLVLERASMSARSLLMRSSVVCGRESASRKHTAYTPLSFVQCGRYAPLCFMILLAMFPALPDVWQHQRPRKTCSQRIGDILFAVCVSFGSTVAWYVTAEMVYEYTPHHKYRIPNSHLCWIPLIFLCECTIIHPAFHAS